MTARRVSAGGIQAAQMLYRRRNWIASVATFSGGVAGDVSPAGNTEMQDPTNAVPALIMHGGDSDFLSPMSDNFESDLNGKGHFNVVCDHAGGHGLPRDPEALSGLSQSL
jgi:hypothetical protein